MPFPGLQHKIVVRTGGFEKAQSLCDALPLSKPNRSHRIRQTHILGVNPSPPKAPALHKPLKAVSPEKATKKSSMVDAAMIDRFLRWPFQAALFWLFWRAASISIDHASSLSGRIFGVIGPRLTSSGKMARNLRQAFPGKSPAEIAEMIRGAWVNLGRVVAEFPHLPRFRNAEWYGRVDVLGEENVASHRDRGQPAVYFSAHLGNWELAAITSVRLRVPMTAVYAPLKNPLIDRMLLRHRQELGCGLVPKGPAGTRLLVQALREGQSLGLIVDRKRKDGALAPFFGRDAWTTTAPARLALKFNCPLIPIRIERLAGARFRATIYPPLEAPAGTHEDKVMALTRQMNAAIESWIREHPDQWWCDTKRWPNKPKQRPKPHPAASSG